MVGNQSLFLYLHTTLVAFLSFQCQFQLASHIEICFRLDTTLSKYLLYYEMTLVHLVATGQLKPVIAKKLTNGGNYKWNANLLSNNERQSISASLTDTENLKNAQLKNLTCNSNHLGILYHFNK